MVVGQGDVWRLYEAGIYNCLGMFGCNLTDEQIFQLEKMEIMNLYLALDNDEAGINARDKITKKLQRYYNIQHIPIDGKDIGDMNINEVKNKLKGII